MIRLPDLELEEASARALEAYQTEVDLQRSYAKRVAIGKDSWGRYSRSAAFEGVKSTLERMCCGARRCAYCEDSYANEIDHFRPMVHYPEHVFRWPNYVYSCGACNGPKNDLFAVFTSSRGRPRVVTRGKGDPVKPPAKGSIALIDPRTENPLDYLWLDLRLFEFTENADEGTRPWYRAQYTIETLALNRRDALITARASAYGSFRARLKEYRQSKEERVGAAQLRALRNEIRSLHHQTVFAEMLRQRTSSAELKALFVGIPEAASWTPLRREPTI